jgi:hypothetical protein
MAKYRKKLETQEQKQVLSVGGNEYEVTGENGKYYFCGDTQFRKVNPNIHVYPFSRKTPCFSNGDIRQSTAGHAGSYACGEHVRPIGATLVETRIPSVFKRGECQCIDMQVTIPDDCGDKQDGEQ